MNIITGGVTAPKGFQAAGIHCGIKDNFTTPQPDKKDLAMILSSFRLYSSAISIYHYKHMSIIYQ